MSRRTHLILALVALASLAGGSLVVREASAGPEVCDQACVMMIEVDGLVPTDLDPVRTPLLWSLAHQGQPDTPDNPLTGAEQRNGYMWQAPRGVMSAGSAPAAASLLTGSYVEQHGIPADEYRDMRESGVFKRFIGPQDDGAPGDEEDPLPISEPDAKTIFQLIDNQRDEFDYAWITGDPGLNEMLGVEDAAASWGPTEPEHGYPGFCAIPRQPADDGLPQTPQEGEAEFSAHSVCPASDSQTIHEAIPKLTSAAAGNVAFTYIHLAGVGQTKLRDGDVDQALADLEFALGRLLREYSEHAATKVKWTRTVLMIVGNHGYERTPLRVPHATADGRDLESYLEGGFPTKGTPVPPSTASSGVTFVPQGTFATVYPNSSDPAERTDVIRKVREELERTGEDSVEAACDKLAGEQEEESPPEGEDPAGEPPVDGECIHDVLYVDPAFDTQHTIASVHESWHYDHIAGPPDPAVRTGSSGELIVTAGKGWAFGRHTTLARPAPTEPVVGAPHDPEPITNAYPAASGGPRNRAIAAIINGPDRVVNALPPTRQWHPVTTTADTGADHQEAQHETLEAANADPVDDAEATGHELQPVTVDFMPTVAALLRLSVDQRQLVESRLLDEAFKIPLFFPVEEDTVTEPDPEPEPIPPPPPIIIPPPPPPPEPPPPPPGYDFYGLLRNLRAQVIDASGNSYATAKPAALMSHMMIKADFGRPLTMVTLTFYREVLSRRDRLDVRRCSAVGAKAKRAACLDAIAAQASKGIEGDLERCKQEDERAKRQSCRYEARTRARFERQKKQRCAATLATRLRRARSGRIVKKALQAPCLVPLAKFDPFTVKRGQVELKVKVPSAYGPSHIGVTVREVRKMTPTERAEARRRMDDPDKPLFPYVGFGPKDGTIVAIADAGRLHRPKPRRARQPSG